MGHDWIVDERTERHPAQIEHDRAHFRDIGRWKYESHRDAYFRHMELSLEDRLVRSLAWTLAELPDWKWSHNGDGRALSTTARDASACGMRPPRPSRHALYLTRDQANALRRDSERTRPRVHAAPGRLH